MSREKETEAAGRKDAFESVLSVEFATWLAVFVPVFVALTLLLKSLDLPTELVLVIGILFGEATTRSVDWFSERYYRRVEGVEERVQ